MSPPPLPDAAPSSTVVAPVLVTGASGNVGREVVRGLSGRGIPFVAAGTNQARLQRTLGNGVRTVKLDLADVSSYAAAVRGMRGLFLLRPPQIANVKSTLLRFIDCAVDAGVEHVVFLSVEGADRHSWVPHHAVERHLIDRGISSTLLRPGFFAQNLGDAYLRDLREDHRLYVPAGNGRVTFVDVRDVAAIAARCFAEPNLRGKAYILTGPEAVTFAEVARQLTEVLGVDYHYQPAWVAGYALHLRRRGLPWMQIAVQTVLHVGLQWGNAERVDPTLERLLGHPSRSIRQYLEDHRSLWEGSGHNGRSG